MKRNTRERSRRFHVNVWSNRGFAPFFSFANTNSVILNHPEPTLRRFSVEKPDRATHRLQYPTSALLRRPLHPYAAIFAGRRAANIGEIQIKRDKHPSFTSARVKNLGVSRASRPFA